MDVPTPTEFRVGTGRAAIAVSAHGGGIRSYVVDGRELLDAYPANSPPTGARGAVLAPWPNRLADGQYTWDGRTYQLPIDEPDRNTSLHGLVTDAAWQVTGGDAQTVSLTCIVEPSPGYPFRLELTVTYRLVEEALAVTTAAVNAGDQPAPFGLGHHPYLLSPTGTQVDSARLLLPAQTVLPPDDRGIPTTAEPVAGTAMDFLTPREIGSLQIDATFTDLVRSTGGRTQVQLRDARGDGVAVWVDESFRYLHVYSGDTLPPGERRRSVAIEPMTCPANALQSGLDVLRLEPGETFTAEWGIHPLRS